MSELNAVDQQMIGFTVAVAALIRSGRHLVGGFEYGALWLDAPLQLICRETAVCISVGMSYGEALTHIARKYDAPRLVGLFGELNAAWDAGSPPYDTILNAAFARYYAEDFPNGYPFQTIDQVYGHVRAMAEAADSTTYDRLRDELLALGGHLPIIVFAGLDFGAVGHATIPALDLLRRRRTWLVNDYFRRALLYRR